MESWAKGDIAICINVGNINPHIQGYPPLLKLYGEYVVNGIYTCQCGGIALDVGLVSKTKTYTICGCGVKLPHIDIHWCYASRFVKKQTKELLQMEINAAVEAEEYELAGVLDKQLKEMQ